MRRNLILVLWVAFFDSFSGSQVWAAPKVPELSLNLKSQVSTEPLTTEKVGEIDPEQVNPHRQRWILQHQLRLVHLKMERSSQPKKEKSQKTEGASAYQIEQAVIEDFTTGFLRGPGPWYQTLQEFPCQLSWNSDLADRFATADGTLRTVQEASELWSNLLNEEKLKLALLLRRVQAPSEKLTKLRAEEVFQDWVTDLIRKWKRPVEGPQEILRKNEWKYYQKAATEAGICPRKGKPVLPSLWPRLWPRPWKDLMEPLPSLGAQSDSPLDDPLLKETRILARAPARLWNGLFTIRVNVQVGDGTLNGRFLIDSSAPKSVLSPAWLEGQGILPALIEVPRAMPQRVRGSQFSDSYGELGKLARVDRLEISGLSIPMREFLLADTEFFYPPDFVGSCCDGVLGQDFLQRYPIEFQPSQPAEVKIWPREKFLRGPDSFWLEMATEAPLRGGSRDLASDLMSGECSTALQGARERGQAPLKGVRWNTGTIPGLILHTPHESQWKASAFWQVLCQGERGDSIQVAQNVKAVKASLLKKGGLTQSFPAVDLGMGLLARGNFTMDLPHGRLWLSHSGLTLPPKAWNRSGLELKFEFFMGDRVLKVVSIQKNSPAQALAKAGLRPGMTVTQVDGLDPMELDLWEIQRHLAGEFGKTVTVQWKTPSGLKIAPMGL